ncbi:MAG: NUDIX hydrolase [Pseudomonadota bacterium]
MKNSENPIYNPWKTIESEQIYDNPWIHVREDKVVNPGGGEGIYGVVHFKNTAIGIIPLDDEQNTWIVGQHRYPLDEYSWEIPMGGAPAGTTPLEGGMRELREETGISAARWHELMKIHTSNSVTDEIGYVFVATDLSFGEWAPEESEELIVRRIPFVDAVDMVLNNSITDGISIAAILRLNVALNSGELTC